MFIIDNQSKLKDLVLRDISYTRSHAYRGTGCSSRKNQHPSAMTFLCLEFNRSCLILVDLLVSKRRHYTLTNTHGGYWNSGPTHVSNTFEMPAVEQKSSAQAR